MTFIKKLWNASKIMKIAIVAPSPINFVVGGAEKFWMGLYQAFNKYTNHPTELFKIPVDEFSFWSIVDSYEKFYKLDLSNFDLIISSKYPAWMCQHPNHIVYMQHTLRGFYDLWSDSLPQSVNTEHDEIKKFLTDLQNPNTTIEQIFDELRILKLLLPIDDPVFDFPGPLIRDIVKALDNRALKNVKKIYAISEEVANRKSYFPEDSDIEVLYHDTTLEGLFTASQKYFFTASRLAEEKRLDLLIEAYNASGCTVPLKIAGTGPKEKYLKSLAQGNTNIEFLGFLSDEQLKEHYSNALAIPFIPYHEDYGLIALEAMKSGKALITTVDSGGCEELLKLGTATRKPAGWIVEPTVASLASIFKYVEENPSICQQYGINAKKVAQNISWEKVALELSKHKPIENNKKKLKILSLNTYGCCPPQGGGQNRIYYLYKELARDFDIQYFAIDYHNNENTVVDGFNHICAKRSEQLVNQETLLNKEVGVTTGDSVLLQKPDFAKEYIRDVQKLAKESDLIILEHPYCLPAVKDIDKPILMSSHNVEFRMKEKMYDQGDAKELLTNLIKDAEQEIYKRSIGRIVCSREDALAFKEEFGFDLPVYVVDNGFDPETVSFTNKELRKYKRKAIGKDRPLALFIGSMHRPNIEAVEFICQLAENMPNFDFVILGTVGEAIINNKPDNVIVTLRVSDEEKDEWFSLATVALNPMIHGGGSNLKLLDYMAAGLPVVTTPFGARGHFINKELMVCCNLDEFENAIKVAPQTVNIEKARYYAELLFSWKALAKRYKLAIEDAMRNSQ